jgi:hypothetical protein
MAIKIIRVGEEGSIIDHEFLIDRNKPNQHTIEAITGLKDLLNKTNNVITSFYPLNDIGTNEKIISKNNLISLEKDVYLKPSLNYTELNLTINPDVTTFTNQILNNPLFNIFFANSLVGNPMDLFKDPLDETKINKMTDNVSHNNGDHKWFVNSPNTPYISLNFLNPIFLTRLELGVNNLNYIIKATDLNDNEIMLGNYISSFGDTNISSFQINKYIKNIYIYSNNFSSTKEDERKCDLHLLRMFTPNSFEGTFEFKDKLGSIITEQLLLSKREGILTDDIISIESVTITPLTKETTVLFKAITNLPIRTKINNLEISYQLYLGNSIYNINKSLIELNNNIDSIQLLHLDSNKNIDFNKTNIKGLKQTLDKASSGVDLTGKVYNDLNERLSDIEKTAKTRINSINELLSSSPIYYQKFKITEDSQYFKLNFEYPVGTHMLKVYIDGAKAEPGLNEDFIETSVNEVTFNYMIEASEEDPVELVFEIPTTSQLKDKITNENYEYTDGKLTKLIRDNGTIETEQYIYDGNKVTKKVTTPTGSYETIYIYNEDGTLSKVIGDRKSYLGEKEFMIPMYIKIRKEYNLSPQEILKEDIYIGNFNQFEIKSIALYSDDEDSFFNINIYDKKEKGFPVYQSGDVSKKIYDILPIIYCDEDNTKKLHIEIQNLFNKNVSLKLRIDGTEIRKN